MRICYTPEMRRLKAIYEPYEEGCQLREDAPDEAIEAKKEFFRLLNEIKEKEIASWFE